MLIILFIAKVAQIFPVNPFDVLSEKPAGYSSDDNKVADVDGEWTFVNWYSEEEDGHRNKTGRITHQRADNTRWQWDYNAGKRLGDNAQIGELGDRQRIYKRLNISSKYHKRAPY